MQQKKFILLFFVIFFLAWIPFLWLSLYNVPIGMHEWEWMTNNAGRSPSSFVREQAFIYWQVMGRYTSNAVLSLTDYWCTLTTFPVFFFGWHLLWIVVLVRTVFLFLHEYPRWLVWIIAGGIELLYLTSLHDVYDTMYRYTGVLTYQSGLVLSMLAFWFWQKHQQSESKVIPGLLCGVFCIAAAGTNEITLLFLLVTVATGIIFSWRSSKKLLLFPFLLFIFLLLCAFVVMYTPANTGRMISEGETTDIATLIGLSLATTSYTLLDWTVNSLLIPVSILLFPWLYVASPYYAKHHLFKNWKPWCMALLVFVVCSFAALMYSTRGNAFPERVIDHVFFYVIFLWLGALISLALKIKDQDGLRKMMRSPAFKWSYLALGAYVIVTIFANDLHFNRAGKSGTNQYASLVTTSSLPTNAWKEIISGNAARYHREAISGLQSLSHCGADTCYIRKPAYIPPMLYDAKSDKRTGSGDKFMGYYFDSRIKRVFYQ